MYFDIYLVFWLFFIYSFLGWCTEVAFQAIAHGKIVNRGFLNGPLCPIYGAGIIGVLLILEPVLDNIILLFFGGMILTTSIELIGGSILDTAFHMRWWDYSNEPYNYRGYICLRFSIIWGLAVVGVVKIIHPLIMLLIDIIPKEIGIIVLVIFTLTFIVDLAATVRSVSGLKKHMNELDKLAFRLHGVSDDLTNVVSSTALKADADLKNAKAKAEEKNEKRKEAIIAKQQEIDEKITENLAQLNSKIESGKAELDLLKNEKIEKISEKYSALSAVKAERMQRTAELEEKYNEIYNEIKKSFGRRRLLKAYPQLHRSNSRNSMLKELNAIKLKLKLKSANDDSGKTD